MNKKKDIKNCFSCQTEFLLTSDWIVQTAARHLDVNGMFLLSLPNGERSVAKFDAQGTVRKTFELDGDEIEAVG